MLKENNVRGRNPKLGKGRRFYKLKETGNDLKIKGKQRYLIKISLI